MQQLQSRLRKIDGKGYKAYKQLVGEYHFPHYRLRFDHVQGDPFADPSRARLFLDSAVMKLPADLYCNPIRTLALEDYIGRRFAADIVQIVKGHRGSGKSGEVRIASYGQQVLARNAVLVRDGAVELRFQIALPADGRRVQAEEANMMLFDELPKLVEKALLTLVDHPEALYRHVNSVEDQDYLRGQLAGHALLGFVADGALLPRASGIDDRPLNGAVSFLSPSSLSVTLRTRHGLSIRGMGIPRGVTLIVGGGFHGKSTLLKALEHGVYNHIPGDGRERVVTDPTAVKVRAEDGRAITGVDISPFIDNLPQGKSTHRFFTENASGSTSQAANIMEALAGGAQSLLIDEDTSATNFMIRDARMQQLVSGDKEPIKPLIQRIGGLSSNEGVSVVLVMGGSSDFFSVADRVIMMDNYQPRDVTEKAHRLSPHKNTISKSTTNAVKAVLTAARTPRCISNSCLDARRGHREKIQALGTRQLRFGTDSIDVGCVEQLVDTGQLLAIGYLLNHYGEQLQAQQDLPEREMVVCLKALWEKVNAEGLDNLTPYTMGTLALPRLHELLATLNRKRDLRLVDVTGA